MVACRMQHAWPWAVPALGLMILLSCHPRGHTNQHPAPHAGLENVIAVAPRIISGSAPENEHGFAELHRRGIRTILSVDGATPDVVTARQYGMRYVHLPVGYHGIDRHRQLELARVVRDLPGPLYVHCHHGRHRGPTAAVVAAVALNHITPDEGITVMRHAGTDHGYAGLYACVRETTPATADELARLPGVFPEISPVPDFVKGMAQAQEAYDHLVEIRDAGWCVPAHHPDLVPLNEAGLLENTLRMLLENRGAHDHDPAFAALLAEAGERARSLEEALARRDDRMRLTERLESVGVSCRNCHVTHRNRR